MYCGGLRSANLFLNFRITTGSRWTTQLLQDDSYIFCIYHISLFLTWQYLFDFILASSTLNWWPRMFFLCNFITVNFFMIFCHVFLRQHSVYGVYLRFRQILAERYTLASLSFSQSGIGKLGFCAQQCFSFSFWFALSFRDAWRPWRPRWSSQSFRCPHCRRPSDGCCYQASPLLAQQHQDVAGSSQVPVPSEGCRH